MTEEILDSSNAYESALVVPKVYSMDHPPLSALASGTAEYSAPLVRKGSQLSLDDVDNAEKQYKTRRVLQTAGLASMEEVLAAKKREYDLLAENAGCKTLPDWVGNLQQQLQHNIAESLQQKLEEQLHQQRVQLEATVAQSVSNYSNSIESIAPSSSSMNENMLMDDTSQVRTMNLLENFQGSLEKHQQAVEQQVQTVTYQINEIGQTLLQESVRNTNRTKVKHDTDPIAALPILESTLSSDTIGEAKVVYPKDKGLWFPERFCQIKTLPRNVKYPAYTPGTEHQVDKLLDFYDLTVATDHLADLEVPEDAVAREILRYKQEALYHFLGVEWC